MARATKKKQVGESPAVITAIKGFDSNWQCRGYQFEIGKSYTHDGPVKACASGFHSCPDHPLDVFEFYPPAGGRFAAVKVSGDTDRDGTKIASATISLTVELSISDLVRRAWDYVWSRATVEGDAATGYRGAAQASGNYGAAQATGDQGAAQASGNYGAAQATGYRGAAQASGNYGAAQASGNYGAAQATGDQGAAQASGNYGAAQATGDQGAAQASGNYGAAQATGYRGAAQASGNYGAAQASGNYGAAQATGDQGAASATGDRGAASATGSRGAAQATGYRGAASVSGKHGHASATGPNGRVMAKGNMQSLFAREFDSVGQLVSVACGVSGQGGIKAGVWYVCKGGNLVEVAP